MTKKNYKCIYFVSWETADTTIYKHGKAQNFQERKAKLELEVGFELTTIAIHYCDDYSAEELLLKNFISRIAVPAKRDERWTMKREAVESIKDYFRALNQITAGKNIPSFKEIEKAKAVWRIPREEFIALLYENHVAPKSKKKTDAELLVLARKKWPVWEVMQSDDNQSNPISYYRGQANSNWNMNFYSTAYRSDGSPVNIRN